VKIYVTFLLSIVVTVLLAQDSITQKKYFINFNLHYGFIVAHNPNMEYLIKRHIVGTEVTLIVPASGEKQWERIYKNPEKGIGMYLSDLGNPRQLGYAAGLFPFVNFPLNPGQRFKLYLRSGNGIGLITKPYERITNHKNNINGSYVNEFIYLRLNAVYCLAKNLRMETGIGLTHLSNGNWAQPNLGINLATVNLAFSAHDYPTSNLKYHPLPDTLRQKRKLTPFISLLVSGGQSELNHRDGKKYGTYALALFGWKPVSPKSRFGLGLDFFYDKSNLARAREGSIYYTSDTGLTNVQAGIRLGYEMVVGKFAIPIEMGSYFFTRSTANGPFYHRVGLRYYANNHLILAYTLKTHWATAENIEFAIGYKF
jgi:Lipid A 3-O-deacylase (PagL)